MKKHARLMLLIGLLFSTVIYAVASQHDMDISNSDANTGTAMRTQINNALKALASFSSGASAPATTYPGQFWLKTGDHYVYQRNHLNTGWVKFYNSSTAKVESAKQADTASNSLLFDNWSSGKFKNASNITRGTLPLAQIPATLTGKDVDTLDGQHGSYYQSAANLTAGYLSKSRLPVGAVIRLAETSNSTNSGTLSTTIPYDGTTPLVSEGTEVLTTNAIANSSSSKLRLSGVVQAHSMTAGGQILVTVFKDSTLLSTFLSAVTNSGQNASTVIPFDIQSVAGDISQHTYSVRAGGIAYSWIHNDTTWFGSGSSSSYLFIDEILQ